MGGGCQNADLVYAGTCSPDPAQCSFSRVNGGEMAESVMKKAPFEVKYTESVRFLQIRDKDIVENHSRKIR